MAPAGCTYTVLAMARDFQNGGAGLARINHSYTILIIPKKKLLLQITADISSELQRKNSQTLLTSGLQRQIDSFVIDPDQTSFICGRRQISEGFVFALELIQTCHKRRNPAIALIKLDFADRSI